MALATITTPSLRPRGKRSDTSRASFGVTQNEFQAARPLQSQGGLPRACDASTLGRADSDSDTQVNTSHARDPSRSSTLTATGSQLGGAPPSGYSYGGFIQDHSGPEELELEGGKDAEVMKYKVCSATVCGQTLTPYGFLVNHKDPTDPCCAEAARDQAKEEKLRLQ
jgi:hypothetical protein